MRPSILQQFGNMLSSRWSLGKDAPPSPKQKAIHEKVTYPRIRPTTNSDSCLNPSMSYEHVLVCGHVIVTPRPDEPCAPNCRHIAIERSSKKNRDALKSGKALDFYCDACVETENEALISDDITSTAAEHMRLGMRETEADKREKQKNFRKCYIGLKVTSVPCHSNGRVRGRYTPRKVHHPFDTAIPQAGDNFFEDVLVVPTEKLNPTSDSGADASAPAFTNSTDVNISPANLGESGANWLRFAQSVADEQRKAASQKLHLIPNVASKTPSIPTNRNPAVVQNSDTALPVSLQQPRKHAMVINEDEDYIDTPEEGTGVFKRLAKRHRKSTISTQTAPAAKAETRHPLKFVISALMALAAKPKTVGSTRKRP